VSAVSHESQRRDDGETLVRLASFVPSAPWGGKGYVTDVGGPVHWVDFGGPDDDAKPVIVMVHGLGGSHLNWVTVAPALAEHARVLAVDLAGFGLTPIAHRSASVRSNAGLLDRFLRRVVGRPVILVGNSMGGMISLLHARRHPDSVAALILVDPAIPLRPWLIDRQVAVGVAASAVPFVGARLARSMRGGGSARAMVRSLANLCFADPTRVSPEVMEADVALAEHRLRLASEKDAFAVAARSLVMLAQNRRSYFHMMSRIEAPTMLVHGSRDRLIARAAADAAAKANPAWHYVVFDGVGHVPQLEVPEAFIEEVLSWLRHTGLLPAP